MTKKKILYIVSNVQKSLSFEWIALELKMDYDISFILLNSTESPIEEFLVRNDVPVKRIKYRGKRDLVFAIVRTIVLLLKNRPVIVHAHLFDAQLIGLVAAWFVGIKKRVYTRHNSNYHHMYHPKGIKFDKLCNILATQIVSLSQATDKTLFDLEKVESTKVVKIPHGFKLSIYENVSNDRIENVRKKWKIQSQQPVVGVIARHIKWKGIQYIIPAFKKFQLENPNAILIMANAEGPYSKEVIELVEHHRVENVVLISFEGDVASLYQIFDMYIHVPVDSLCEAFGQTYIEALASGVPSIFTLSGIAAEFIVHKKNAWVVDFKNSNEIYEAMCKLWSDERLRELIRNRGRHDVALLFNIETMMRSLKELYR